ncbi:hypothetical protein V5F22_12895 [Acinetobacter baumannii]
MNPLINFWDWLGSNSGQLQTLLTLIGLVFAFIAAKYAKDQFNLANQQRLEGLQLTAYNLKLSILANAYECKELIYSAEHKQKKWKERFTELVKLFHLNMKDKMPGYEYTYEEYINIPDELLVNPKNLVNQLIEKIPKDNDSITHQDLELYLKTLISIKGSIHSANEGIERRIEEMSKMMPSSQSIYPHN